MKLADLLTGKRQENFGLKPEPLRGPHSSSKMESLIYRATWDSINRVQNILQPYVWIRAQGDDFHEALESYWGTEILSFSEVKQLVRARVNERLGDFEKYGWTDDEYMLDWARTRLSDDVAAILLSKGYNDLIRMGIPVPDSVKDMFSPGWRSAEGGFGSGEETWPPGF